MFHVFYSSVSSLLYCLLSYIHLFLQLSLFLYLFIAIFFFMFSSSILHFLASLSLLLYLLTLTMSLPFPFSVCHPLFLASHNFHLVHQLLFRTIPCFITSLLPFISSILSLPYICITFPCSNCSFSSSIFFPF